MFVLGNLLIALADVLDVLFKTLEIVILVRVILSWANADSYNQFVRVVILITEPFLSPFRKFLQPWRMGGLDLSPACVVFSLYFIRLFLIPTLYDLARQFHG